jgi:hypothetical protein
MGLDGPGPRVESTTGMAKTMNDLVAVAAEFPDAAKWWLGDWVNEGEKRFGLTVEEAHEISLTNAVLVGALSAQRDLPREIQADATSLTLPPDLTRKEWEQLGGVLVVVHQGIKPLPDT